MKSRNFKTLAGTAVACAIAVIGAGTSAAQGLLPERDAYVEQLVYWSLKAQCWKDLARAESAQGDVRGTAAIALQNADVISEGLMAGSFPVEVPIEKPIFSRRMWPGTDPVHGRPGWNADLLAVDASIERYHHARCHTPQLACAEVAQQSAWENMEESQGARWNHGRPELDRAVSLAREIDNTFADSCSKPQMQEVLSPPAPPVTQEVLLADLFFAFDSAQLSLSGKNAVGLVVQRLIKTSPSRSWTVTGHADRLGSATHNQALSLLRAQAVAKTIALLAPDVRVTPLSAGSSSPVVDCLGPHTPQTVTCLGPNRRVVIRPIE